jgi:hypothetical protein
MPSTSYPSQFELALLAAIVAQGNKKPLDAMCYAWDLWEEAGAALEYGGPAAASLLKPPDAEIRKHWQAKGEAPEKFPATLRDFLRLIVRARTPADSMKRLRDWFRHENATHQAPEAADRITQIKAADQQGGYFTRFDDWRALAVGYKHWWSGQKSLKASQSAKKKK